MTITAIVGDQTLEFPDGTSNEVISATAKKVAGGTRDQLPANKQAQQPAPAPVEQKSMLDVTDPDVLAGNPATGFALGAASPALGMAELASKAPAASPLLMLLKAAGSSLDVKGLHDAREHGRASLGGEGLDASEMAGGLVGPGIAAGTVAPVVKSLLARMGIGAGIGAGVGLTTPTSGKPEDFADEKAQQIGGGALVGGVLPAAGAALAKAGKTVYHGLIEPWANPAAIKGRAYLEAAGDKTKEIIDLLTKNRQIVPGSEPTAGQAAVPAGRAEFSALQESAGKVKPSDYLARNDQQNAARQQVLAEIAGAPEQQAAARAARKEAAGPLYEAGAAAKLPAVKGAKGNMLEDGKQSHWDIDPGAMPGEPGYIYKGGKGAVVELENGKYEARLPGGDALGGKQFESSDEAMAAVERVLGHEPMAGFKALNDRPSMQAALGRAQKLIEEETGKKVNLSGSGHGLTGAEAQKVKMAFDDMVSYGQKSGIETAELNALKATRGDYVKWMEQEFPVLQTARAAYKEASKPINQMDVGRTLEEKLTPALRDDAKQRAGVFSEAVRNAPATLKKATGEPRYTQLEDILTARQLKGVNSVQNDLAQGDRHLEMARRGAGTANAIDLATQNMEREAGGKIPNMLHRGVMLANAVIARMEGKVNRKLASEMATEMLNPPKVGEALGAAQAREARNKLIADAILRAQPLMSGVAAAGVARNQGEE